MIKVGQTYKYLGIIEGYLKIKKIINDDVFYFYKDKLEDVEWQDNNNFLNKKSVESKIYYELIGEEIEKLVVPVSRLSKIE